MEIIDWKKSVEEWSQSGLSKAEYCRQHDLIYTTFVTHARKHIQQRQLSNSAVGFVRVESKTVVEAFQDRNSGVRLNIADVEITLDADFDQNVLSTVIGVLRAGF